MTQDGQRLTRKPLLVNVAWCVALLSLPVLYVASYPIALRFRADSTIGHTPGYQPVEWLIDETPLYHPMWWWADIFGAGQQAIERWELRWGERLNDAIDP